MDGWNWRPVGMVTGLALIAAGCVHYEARPLHPVQTAHVLEGRSLESPSLRTFLEASLGHPMSQWPQPAWSFDTLSLAAVFFSPELATLRAQREIADAAIQTAAAHPNPTVGLQGGYNFDAGHTGITPWIPGTTLDLPIETAGKRSRRMERAGHLAQAARWNLAAAAWTVRASIRVALLETIAAETKGSLLSETLECTDRMGRILEQRLEAGAATTLEVNSARVNRLRLSADVADARRAAMEARQHLAALIGVPGSALHGIQFLPPPSHPAPNAATQASLRTAALQERADIQSSLAAYEASESQLRLEIAKQYPDLHLGNGYQWDQGDSKWTFGLNLELPVLNRNQGGIAEAIARRTEAAAQVMAVQSRVLGDLEHAASLMDLLQHQREDAQVLAEALRLQTQRVRARAEQGGADRLEVETTRLEELTQRLSIADLELRFALAQAAWEAAVQRPLEAMTYPPNQPVPAPTSLTSP